MKRKIICFNILMIAITITACEKEEAEPELQPIPSKPRGQMYHNLRYDPVSGNMVLFPGCTAHSMTGVYYTNELWEYKIDDNEWVEIQFDLTVSLKDFTTIAFDTESERFITFDKFGHTLAYIHNTFDWTDMDPAVSPPNRCGQGMIYDIETDRIIMFGGWGCQSFDDSEIYFTDTWSYDYNSNTWKKMEPSSAPSERIFFSMAYDIENDKVVLWGGRKLEAIQDVNVWAYDYNKDIWEQLEIAGGPDHPLAYSTMVYRSESQDFFLFGGSQITSSSQGIVEGILEDDTWTFDINGGGWSQLDPVNSPTARANHSLAYDPTSNTVVLFGGELYSLYSGDVSDEAWKYFSNNWVEQ